MPNKLNSCLFCGEMHDINVVVKQNSNVISAHVLCRHCSARGTTITDTLMINGKFEQTVDELAEQATEYWNNAGK